MSETGEDNFGKMSTLSTVKCQFFKWLCTALSPTHVYSVVFFELETFPASSFVFRLCSVNEGCQDIYTGPSWQTVRKSDGWGKQSSRKTMPCGYVNAAYRLQ